MAARTLPGSSGLPVIGETPAFLLNQLTFLETRIRAYGSIFRTHILRLPTLMSCSYAATVDILHPRASLSAAKAYAEFLGPLYPVPNLLLTETDSVERQLARKYFLPALSPAALQPLSGALTALVARHLDALAARAADSATSSLSVRPYAFFKALSQDAITTLLLGAHPAPALASLHALSSSHFNGVIAAPLHVDLPFAKSSRAKATHSYHALEASLARLISSRFAAAAPAAPAAPDCVLDGIVARVRAARADSAALRAQLAQFLLLLLSPATTKSVASALASVARELRAENGGGGGVAEDARAGGARLHAVLMEVVRLHPPLAGGMRLTGGAAVTVAGHEVRGRWRVWYSIRHANRDEGVYERAERFEPRRWAGAVREEAEGAGCPFARPGEESGECRTPLSFGAGERHCPGRDLAWMVMAEAAREFVRRFEVEKGEAGPLRFLPVLREASDEEIVVRLRR